MLVWLLVEAVSKSDTTPLSDMLKLKYRGKVEQSWERLVIQYIVEQ